MNDSKAASKPLLGVLIYFVILLSVAFYAIHRLFFELPCRRYRFRLPAPGTAASKT